MYMSTNKKITLNNGKAVIEKMKATQPEEYFAVLKEPVLFTEKELETAKSESDNLSYLSTSEEREKLFRQIVLGEKTESE